MTGPAARIIASLLPRSWPDRQAVLDAADRVDREHPDDAIDTLLDAWNAWRGAGDLPDSAPLRDIIGTLSHVLGGVQSELRRRPRPRRAKA